MHPWSLLSRSSTEVPFDRNPRQTYQQAGLYSCERDKVPPSVDDRTPIISVILLNFHLLIITIIIIMCDINHSGKGTV